jgi:rubrerythrin
VEELEALRLADLEAKTQEEAADSMKVSRQTFGRVIGSARTKVADALVSGKSILIQGGSYEMEKREFKCADCGHVWEAPFGTPRPDECPECNSTNLHRIGGPRMARHGHGQCCCSNTGATRT